MKRIAAFLLVLISLWAMGPERLHAQDAEALLQQLTALQQQLSETSDPCPLMPRFRELMSQFASQSPEMYQAMKPTLDLLNSSGDGCSADSGGATSAALSTTQGTIVANAPPPPGSMASQFLGKPGVTQKCFEAKGSYQCEYFKNGAWLGTELVCPASGFSGMRQTGDTAVGIPCTPGQPINSASNSTSNGGSPGGSSVSSTGSSGPSGGTGGSSNGSSASSAGMTLADPLKQCVTPSYDNDNLTFTDTCNVSVYVEWWIGGHSGSWTIDPGNFEHTGYSGADVAAGGGDNYYVCPKNYSPVDSSYKRITSAVSNYTCRSF